MKSKKAIAGILSAAVLSASAFTAFGAEPGALNPIAYPEKQEEKAVLADSGWDKKERSYFGSFTGIVQKIEDFRGLEGSKFVSVENEEGMPANFIISAGTYIVDNAEIEVGAVITGFFKADAPRIMIYPPQYGVDVVVVEKEGQYVKADLFDEDLVSADRSLKLNVSDDTEVLSEDGEAFEGELADRKLVVIYTTSTKSIPAQTIPQKIIVLKEETAPISDVSILDIVVNGEKIEAEAPYRDEQGVIMVPLRGIAEALGFDVSWNAESRKIVLDQNISLVIGKDQYMSVEAVPIQLGAAPEIIEGRTFVPLDFFKELLRIHNVQVRESQILIDDKEIENKLKN